MKPILTSPWRWAWHALAVLILVFGCWVLFKASQRVDYTWRWERVPQYLLMERVITSGDVTRAPFQGFVSISPDGKTLTLKAMQGSADQTFTGFSEAMVHDGDLVFEGDVLARSHVQVRRQMVPGPLTQGLILTLELSALSLVVSLILGLLIGLARVSRNATISDLAAVYVEIIRGTPLLVQIFIVYFFFGTVLKLSGFAAGVVALSIFTAAYVAEIIRAGIQAVPKGQIEASQSLGLSGYQTMRYVVLPQAMRRTLPPLAGQSINLIKDSSLVSVVALTDLTKAGREVVSSTFSTFEVWFTVALLYLILTGTLSLAVRRLEKRMARND